MKKNVKETAVTAPLQGKTVALTGSTGGIGRALSRALAEMGASLILLDRNETKAKAWAEALAREFEDCRVTRYTVDLSDMDAVKATALPCVEVHISKLEEREDFRQISYVRLACTRTITGLGIDGYLLGIDHLIDGAKK